jgi:TIR domain
VFGVLGSRHSARQDFSAYLQKQIDAARCMIVLWSTTSLSSQFVRDEAAEGLNGRLVPVRIDNVRPPPGFRQLQSADLTAWRAGTKHEEFDRFMESIEGVLRSKPESAVNSPAVVDALHAGNAHLEWREDRKGGLDRAVLNDTSEALRDVWIKVLDIRLRSQAGDFVEVQNLHGAGQFEEFSIGAGFGSDSYPDQPLVLRFLLNVKAETKGETADTIQIWRVVTRGSDEVMERLDIPSPGSGG